MHVAEAKSKLGSRFDWLCDSMTNDLKHALGDAPNSEFLIGPDGRILRSRRWSRPEELRADLAKLLGEVQRPTTTADIGMNRLAPAKTAAKGIVPRIELPGRMTPVKVQPLGGSPRGGTNREPFYVKLRAEVDQQFFQNGKGKLYLGFFLDPLYKVHWNNQAAPIEYEIDRSGTLEVSPRSGTGPQVEAAADADPREFLVSVSGSQDSSFKLTVKYFACDDAETFCKPVTQHYQVVLERDRDGGSRRSFGGRGGRFAGGNRPQGFDRSRFGPGRGGPGGRFARGDFGRFGESNRPPPRQRDPDAESRSKRLKTAVALLKKHDANRDGKLGRQELARIRRPVGEADANSDGKVSLRELLDWLARSAAAE